ncbi:MAG: HD-GYP domain-containing protein [Treponema sp.]|nr:HD-GYP domain-containing protein [Treponema sp.]
MKDFLVKEIPRNSFFTKAVYLDQFFVLITPEMPFARELSEILERWSFDEVHSDGEPRKNYTNDQVMENISEGGIVNLSLQTDKDKIQQAEIFYTSLQSFVDDLFIRAAVSNEMEFNKIAEKIRGVVDFVREGRRFLMRVLKNAEPASNKNYLPSHSVRSTILAVIIGTYLKLPNHRLLELGVAALLHEVGMLKLPQQMYMSMRRLNEEEQKSIKSHPVLGYSMLKSLDFPLAVCLAALEHHERENGSGYPRHLGGDKISLYSKIIAVACSYDALSSKRPHKEAKDGYTGMLELLKNEGKQYDDTVVRALVLSISIYPIGLYVLLSNGKKGQVIDVNPENPRFPIVQIFGEFTPDGKVKTAQTAPNVITIIRPLIRSEIENQ